MWESRRLFQASVGISTFQRISIETAFSIGHETVSICYSSVFGGSAVSAPVEAKAPSLHLNHLGMSQESVKNGCGCGNIAEKLSSILSWPIRGNQSRVWACDKFVGSGWIFFYFGSSAKFVGINPRGSNGLWKCGKAPPKSGGTFPHSHRPYLVSLSF